MKDIKAVTQPFLHNHVLDALYKIELMVSNDRVERPTTN